MNMINSQFVIFFDGVCNLCNGSVQFILKHEKSAKYQFSSLQSDFANTILNNSGEIKTDSVILYENGNLYYKSSAALRISADLKFPYCLFRIFSLVPLAIRDKVYDYIACNRYKWFGKMDSCMIPSNELKNRFLN